MLLWIVDNVLILYSSEFCMIYDLMFRVIMSLFSALIISLGMGSYVIKWLRSLHVFQIVRSNGPKLHVLKQGTPTMGGAMMLISIIVSVLMWADLSNLYIWCVLFILVAYGILGLIDDLLKIKKMNTTGLSALYKYFWQSLIALILMIFIFAFNKNIETTQLLIPFFKNTTLQFGACSIIIAYFVIVGTSNAVNLSDGLDGLAVIPIILIATGLALVSWATNSIYFSNCLNIPYLYYSGEITVVCVAIIGSGIGFLWFNTYPAQIFMGDVGSLSLGGALGVIAILLRQEFLLLIMGGIFVIETLSVILQIGYFKFSGKRIFRMAPIHHHFELTGCPEPRVIVRFWIMSLIFVIFGLITLKM